jgi:FkbM family methyltransferase
MSGGEGRGRENDVNMLGQAGRTLKFILRHPLGRRRPLRCVANLVRWQLVSRIRPGPHLIPFVGGAQLWARRGETGITGNIYVGLHEFAEMCFVAHALRPGDLFVDVGANAGSYTVLASAVAGARTIAIEPAPETVERLRANVALNGLEARVRVETCAVGARDGSALFSEGLDTANHVVTADAAETATVDVPLRRLDDILAADRPSLIKLDVEGYEFEALEGAASVLSQPTLRAVVVELSELHGEMAAKLLTRQGFEPVDYDPLSRALRPAEAAIGSGNTLFARDVAHLRTRLARAAKLLVLGIRA